MSTILSPQDVKFSIWLFQNNKTGHQINKWLFQNNKTGHRINKWWPHFNKMGTSENTKWGAPTICAWPSVPGWYNMYVNSSWWQTHPPLPFQLYGNSYSLREGNNFEPGEKWIEHSKMDSHRIQRPKGECCVGDTEFGRAKIGCPESFFLWWRGYKWASSSR